MTGRAREDPHRKSEKTNEQKAHKVPVVQIDNGFFVAPTEDPKKLRRMDEVPREMRVSRPMLAMVNINRATARPSISLARLQKRSTACSPSSFS